MTSIFDRWTDLDPALALRRIEAAHGSAVFDRFAYLDPQRALKQIESAFSITLDDVEGVLNFRFLEAAIDAAVAGGEDTPNWVPANAKIYIDLVNNRAWTEADGVVAIDTLLGTDPNTQNGIGTSLYDPAKLTVDGYADASAFPALIGGARAAIVAGATLRYSTKAIKVDDQSPFFAFVSADGHDGVDVDTNSTLTSVYSYGGPAAQVDNTKRLNSGIIGAISAIAFTVTATRLEATVNGSASPIALTLNDTTDRPSGNPLVAAAIVLNSDATALQSITIYDALPNTTGLSALSETGVTNTAPHSLVYQYTNGNVGGGGQNSPTFTEDYWAGQGDPPWLVMTNQTMATDDEGNPLTWSIVAGGLSGKITTTGEPSANGQVIVNEALSAGTYNFTLRATDSGGLYVEQTFTITVTA